MLSYQHMYHAGCLADVQKHAALSIVLAKMVEKDKPVSYIETHAGRGVYDLNSKEAQKTGEALHGIMRVVDNIPLTHPFRKVVNETKAFYGKTFYPGSPLIAKTILREEDRLHLMELHPQEFGALQNNMGNFRNVFVYNKEGYQHTLAISPPVIKRGLVVVDPSYEVKTEYGDVAEFLLKLHKKWPVAAMLLWYPILSEGYHRDMCARLHEAQLPKFWQQEIMYKPGDKTLAKGTGLISFNMPYGIEEELDQVKSILR